MLFRDWDLCFVDSNGVYIVYRVVTGIHCALHCLWFDGTWPSVLLTVVLLLTCLQAIATWSPGERLVKGYHWKTGRWLRLPPAHNPGADGRDRFQIPARCLAKASAVGLGDAGGTKRAGAHVPVLSGPFLSCALRPQESDNRRLLTPAIAQSMRPTREQPRATILGTELLLFILLSSGVVVGTTSQFSRKLFVQVQRCSPHFWLLTPNSVLYLSIRAFLLSVPENRFGVAVSETALMMPPTC